MKRKVFFTAGILLLLAIVWGFYLYNKPHGNTAGLDAAFRIPATDLYRAFLQNETSANKKFMGKVVEVTGPVADIQTRSGNTNILMEGSETGGINCSFSGPPLPSAASLKKGNTVTIKGRCTGFLMDVNLVDCVLE